ncbi:unnamed protein product [Mycena citricolor]|uniref:F-box domain-containing protein n=1 Tax=Mycena citricolor TaxID=2018698 RepID=A0AAD2H9J9_9AGAR|nr:unnamed protein product [Mycena citricolor]
MSSSPLKSTATSSNRSRPLFLPKYHPLEAMSSAAPCTRCGADSSSVTAPETLVPSSLFASMRALSNTNQVPLDSELRLMRSIVEQAKTKLSRLEEEVVWIEERRCALKAETASLAQFYAENAPAVSAVRRMPYEVLCEIFRGTLPSVAELHEERKIRTTQFPWVLTQVSRRWRTTAVSLPSLWSRVIVNFSDEDKHISSNAYPQPLLATQLGRARSLSVHFASSGSRKSGTQAHLFKFLAGTSCRWTELELVISCTILRSLQLLQSNLPALKRLRISWDDSWENDYDSASSHVWWRQTRELKCFEAAPSLRHLMMRKTSTRQWPIRLPFHLLTTCQIRVNDLFQGCLALLTQATHLIRVRIEIHTEQESQIINFRRDRAALIRLPSLTHCYVSHFEILGYFILPALEDLVVECEENEDIDNFVQTATALVTRSTCVHLRALSLKSLPLAAIQLSEQIPSITELRTFHSIRAGSQLTRKLMPSLVVYGSQPIVAPQLQSILIYALGESVASFDLRLYRAMLHSRLHAEPMELQRSFLLLSDASALDSDSLASLHGLTNDQFRFTLLLGDQALEYSCDLDGDLIVI